MTQAVNPPPEATKSDPKPDPVAEIFSERAMAALLKGPAGWLWRAPWVAEGLAARKEEEAQDDTPAILKGWRRL